MDQAHIDKMQAARRETPPTVDEYCQQFTDAGIDSETIRQARVRLKQMNLSLRLTYSRVILGTASSKVRIKCFCTECMGYEKYEVAGCTDKGCALYGVRPIYRAKTSKNAKTDNNDAPSSPEPQKTP